MRIGLLKITWGKEPEPTIGDCLNGLIETRKVIASNASKDTFYRCLESQSMLEMIYINKEIQPLGYEIRKITN